MRTLVLAGKPDQTKSRQLAGKWRSFFTWAKKYRPQKRRFETWLCQKMIRRKRRRRRKACRRWRYHLCVVAACRQERKEQRNVTSVVTSFQRLPAMRGYLEDLAQMVATYHTAATRLASTEQEAAEVSAVLATY
jgi:hypothetical protein